MKRYEGHTWHLVRSPPGAAYEGLELIDCMFSACSLGARSGKIEERCLVRQVRLRNCKVDGGSVGPVLFEDVDVADLRTTGSAGWIRGGLFKHVVLSGKFGTIILTDDLLRLWDPTPEIQHSFDAFASAFYSDVDWALDIREARFRELDWRLNLPARLVRRDPETQIIVTRKKAAEGAWRALPLDVRFSGGLESFLGRTEGAETLLIAARAASYFKQQVESIRLLREAGIAEPC